MEAITEVYEPQWSGSDPLYAQASSIEVLLQDFSHKLGDQVLIPLNTYTAQFPEMRVSKQQSTDDNNFAND
jgi:amphiphysin